MEKLVAGKSWALSVALVPAGILGPLGYGLGDMVRHEPTPVNDMSRLSYEEASACTAYLQVARIAYADSPSLRPQFVRYGLNDEEALDRALQSSTAWLLVLARDNGADQISYERKSAIKLTMAFAEKPEQPSQVAPFMSRVNSCLGVFAPALSVPSAAAVADAVSVVYGPGV